MLLLRVYENYAFLSVITNTALKILVSLENAVRRN
jgi:hypothetical protein